MNKKNNNFINGLRAGVPIGLGYLSVSFTFGIMAVSFGIYWWQALMISMLNLTSAGQLAGITVMLSPGNYAEMFISQLTINIRYSFMSVALSQKVDGKFRGIWRWLFANFVTDEIFAVAITQKSVTRSFMAGLAVMPYIGWSMGTLLGALLGSVLPASVMSALNIAIYAMFVAIVVPVMKKSKSVIIVVAISAIISVIFKYVPGLSGVPAGITISICAVIAAVIGAVFFPVDEDENKDVNEEVNANV